VSNASTVRRQVSGTQQLTTAPLLVATAATESAFQLNNNGLTLTGGGIVPLMAGVTGLYQGTGQVLHIRATGTYTCTVGTVFTLALYQVSAASIAAGLTSALIVSAATGETKIATSTGITTARAAGGFTFDARLQLDSLGNLNGQFTTEIEDQISIWADTTVATGLLGEQDLNFVLTALSTTHTVGSLILTEFALDLE